MPIDADYRRAANRCVLCHRPPAPGPLVNGLCDRCRAREAATRAALGRMAVGKGGPWMTEGGRDKYHCRLKGYRCATCD